MAGLGAARELLENGCSDILILEASDRPGGRIHTISVEGGVLELGAQWLHNTTDSLYELARQHDLIAEQTSDEGLGIYIRDDGTVLDDFLVKTVDFQVGKILEECEHFVDAANYPYSVGEFLEERFDDYINRCDDSKEIKEMKLEIFDWNVLFQIIDNSCLDLRQLSAKEWGKYTCLGKNGQAHINIKNGYQSLIDILVENLPEGVLQTNTPVYQIDYSNAFSNKINLRCQSLNVISDYVIVTSSVGALKKHHDIFNPALPKHILHTVNEMGFYGMGKVYLFFETKWWNCDGFQLIWRRAIKLRGEEKWTRFITGFDVVMGHENILMGWVGGEGVALMEELDEELIGRHCVELLRTFLKTDDVPYPKKVIR